MIDYETANREVSYNPETGELVWKEGLKYRKAGVKATVKGRTRLMIYFKKLQYPAHRIAWLLTHKTLSKHQIYHLNGDTFDNRLVNLAESKTLTKGTPLTVERVRELFDCDHETGLLTWRRPRGSKVSIGDAAGSHSGGRRGTVWIDSKGYVLTRVVWIHYYGEVPAMLIDHVNGNVQDNRIINLRLATNRLNSQNQRRPQKRNTTGFLGVGKAHKKFVARILLPDGSKLRSRTFTTPEEAHEQYLIWKRQHHEGCTI